MVPAIEMVDASIERVDASRKLLFSQIRGNVLICACEVFVAAVWIFRVGGPVGYAGAGVVEILAIVSGVTIGRLWQMRSMLGEQLLELKRSRGGILEYGVGPFANE
jgi:hypothetical protein